MELVLEPVDLGFVGLELLLEGEVGGEGIGLLDFGLFPFLRDWRWRVLAKLETGKSPSGGVRVPASAYLRLLGQGLLSSNSSLLLLSQLQQ